MSEAGTEASFSSRKRIASALGSVGESVKEEIAELIAIVIEIPLYYLALARTELYSTVRVCRSLNLLFCPPTRGRTRHNSQASCHSLAVSRHSLSGCRS